MVRTFLDSLHIYIYHCIYIYISMHIYICNHCIYISLHIYIHIHIGSQESSIADTQYVCCAPIAPYSCAGCGTKCEAVFMRNKTKTRKSLNSKQMVQYQVIWHVYFFLHSSSPQQSHAVQSRWFRAYTNASAAA